MIENEMEVAGGVRLPAGQMVLIPFYTIMRSTQEWDAPGSFSLPPNLGYKILNFSPAFKKQGPKP
jgi:cytochrome P450